MGLRVHPNAPIVGRSLAEVAASVEDRRFLTAAISRNGETIVPRGDNRFEANDQVYIIGESQQMQLVMEMAGYGEENLVTIHWPDPLPRDQRSEVEADKFELDYNVTSIETVQSRRGLDPEIEGERIQAQEVAQGNIGAMLVRDFTQGQQTGFEA